METAFGCWAGLWGCTTDWSLHFGLRREKVHDVSTVQTSERRQVGTPRSHPFAHLCPAPYHPLVVSKQDEGQVNSTIIITPTKHSEYSKQGISLAGQSLLSMYAAYLVITKVNTSTVHCTVPNGSRMINPTQPNPTREKLKAQRNAVANAETPPGNRNAPLSENSNA